MSEYQEKRDSFAALCYLKDLVNALDKTHWSSWQTTAPFDKELDISRSFIEKISQRPEPPK